MDPGGGEDDLISLRMILPTDHGVTDVTISLDATVADLKFAVEVLMCY